MIAPDWLLYLGAAVLVLIALRLAGAFSRRGQVGVFRANLETKKKPQRRVRPRSKAKTRPR